MNNSELAAGALLAVSGFALIAIIVDYISIMSGLAGASGAPTLTELAAYAAAH